MEFGRAGEKSLDAAALERWGYGGAGGAG